MAAERVLAATLSGAEGRAPGGYRSYAKIRHPQYVAFVLVMFGFLLQWPTVLTLAMFPVLVFMYWRLGVAEERDSLAAFGADYVEYMRTTPAFIPRLRPRSGPGPGARSHPGTFTSKESVHVINR